MRIQPRVATLPPDFIKRFTDIFPESEVIYARINRRLQRGLIDEVATFLLGELKKFSAAEILSHVDDSGQIDPAFMETLRRHRDIDALYSEINTLIRALS